MVLVAAAFPTLGECQVPADTVVKVMEFAPVMEYDLEEEGAEYSRDEELYEAPPHHQVEVWLRGASSPQTFTDIRLAKKLAKDVVRMEFQSINGGALPKEISKFKALEDLQLNFPDSAMLPKQLWKVKQLRRLSISSQRGVTISPAISGMINLQELLIDGGRECDSYLPDEVGQVKSLERLVLVNNRNLRLPDRFDLPRLRLLDIEFSGIEKLPGGWEASPLDTLVLEAVGLDELPGAIGKLSHLKFLNLQASTFTELPDEVGELQGLEELQLSFCKLERLPESIGKLKSLRSLDLSWTPMESLPEAICQLENLTTLDAFSSHLQSLPAHIGDLHSLRELVLRGNPLKYLPASLGDLQNLEHLYLEETDLETLPASIGGCANLRRLSLVGTPLKVLPREILNLEQLRDFECDRTGLLESGEEVWAFLNQHGHVIPVVPDTIAGKPLSHYLARPDIDLGAKLYVQGRMKLNTDRLTMSILDSVLTDNPETMPFYAHIFLSCVRPGRGRAFDNFSLLPDETHFLEVGGAFVLKQPCWFFDQVKWGPYASLYPIWAKEGKFSPEGLFLTDDELIERLRETLNQSCPGAHDEDLEQLRQELEDRW